MRSSTIFNDSSYKEIKYLDRYFITYLILPKNWVAGFGTNAWGSQSPLPYRLAIPPWMKWRERDSNPRTRRERIYSPPRLASSLSLHINQQDLLYHWFIMIASPLFIQIIIFYQNFNGFSSFCKENPHFHFDNGKLPTHVCNFTQSFSCQWTKWIHQKCLFRRLLYYQRFESQFSYLFTHFNPLFTFSILQKFFWWRQEKREWDRKNLNRNSFFIPTPKRSFSFFWAYKRIRRNVSCYVPSLRLFHIESWTFWSSDTFVLIDFDNPSFWCFDIAKLNTGQLVVELTCDRTYFCFRIKDMEVIPVLNTSNWRDHSCGTTSSCFHKAIQVINKDIPLQLVSYQDGVLPSKAKRTWW